MKITGEILFCSCSWSFVLYELRVITCQSEKEHIENKLYLIPVIFMSYTYVNRGRHLYECYV